MPEQDLPLRLAIQQQRSDWTVSSTSSTIWLSHDCQCALRITVVENERLQLKARLGSAASLVGRGGRRRAFASVTLGLCGIEQHVGRQRFNLSQ